MSKITKQAIVNKDMSVMIESDVPIPEPGIDEIIVEAVYAGVNPIDWKQLDHDLSVALHGEVEAPVHRAIGKDWAGYVRAVGSEAYQFRVGDRVMCVNHSGGFAEYSVGKAYASAILPDNVSFEGIWSSRCSYVWSTLPHCQLVHVQNKSLPTPWNPAPQGTRTPLAVYGASSSLGAFAIKLAKLANIHPIIAIAGASSGVIEGELDSSKGDLLVDYRQGEAKLIEIIKKSVPDLHYVADAIGSTETMVLCSKFMNSNDSSLTSSVGEPLDEDAKKSLPPGIKVHIAFSPAIFEPYDPEGSDGPRSPNIGLKAFGTRAMAYLSYALQRDILKPHPYEVRPNGLEGLSDSLKDLKNNKNKGLRYIADVQATPGFEKRRRS